MTAGCAQTISNTKPKDSSAILEDKEIAGVSSLKKEKNSLPKKESDDDIEMDEDAISDEDENPCVTEIDPDCIDSTIQALVEGQGDVQSTEYIPKAEKEEPNALDEALELCRISQDFWQKGELENALGALDGAYSLIVEVDTEDSPKLIQQKDDLRFMISKRILEIYASRHIVVNGKHNAIPIVMNDHVEKELSRFTTGGEKDFFKRAYKRSGKYREMIEKELEKAGLPKELSWLPLIESGFSVRAFSSARALGLWQFIPSTGYKFGLKRNRYIDERMDPMKSTKAAIAYLKELHNLFGDWATVLAAYNCGEGRVLKVIRRQNVNYLDNFWDLYKHLPRETARYVPRFMATLHMVKNAEKYGLDKLQICTVPEVESVKIDKGARLTDIAKLISASEKSLRELNPELRYGYVPGDNYDLKVPKGEGKTLIAKLDEIPATRVAKASSSKLIYHRVHNGETLSTIAEKYKTSVRSIMRVNNLARKHFIVAGKVIKVPAGRYYVRSTKSSNKEYETASHHKVSRGDSLWIIARRYGTTTKALQDVNGLTTTHLHIGQVLKIPQRKTATKSAGKLRNNTRKIYYVKRGDIPMAIAKRFNVSLERLLKVNNLSKRSTIYPGQALTIE